MNMRFAGVAAFALFMAASSVFSHGHAAGKGDVWQCRKSGADGLIYVNTGQAERNMDPKLWARIQKDRKAADETSKTEEEGGMADFDLFKKDAESLANISIVSKKPLRLAVSGGIAFDNSEKSVWSNIVAMISGVVDDGEGKHVESGTKKRPVHEFKVKLEDGEWVGLRIEEEDAFARFELLYNLDAAPPSGEECPVPSRMQAISNVRSGNSAIGIVLNPSAWAGVFSGKDKEKRVFNRLLRAMETTEIRVRVNGVMVEAFLSGTFKSDVLARRYSKDLLDSLPTISQTLDGGILADIKPNMSGRVVSINLKARLDLAWDRMMVLNKKISSSVSAQHEINSVDTLSNKAPTYDRKSGRE